MFCNKDQFFCYDLTSLEPLLNSFYETLNNKYLNSEFVNYQLYTLLQDAQAKFQKLFDTISTLNKPLDEILVNFNQTLLLATNEQSLNLALRYYKIKEENTKTFKKIAKLKMELAELQIEQCQLQEKNNNSMDLYRYIENILINNQISPFNNYINVIFHRQQMIDRLHELTAGQILSEVPIQKSVRHMYDDRQNQIWRSQRNRIKNKYMDYMALYEIYHLLKGSELPNSIRTTKTTTTDNRINALMVNRKIKIIIDKFQ